MGKILAFQGKQKKFVPKTDLIHTVTGLKEGKSALQKRQYQIVLIDLDEAGDKGMEFACFLRALHDYYLTPVIFFAKDDTYQQEAFHDIHCYDYLLKPVSYEEILKIIHLYLSTKEKEPVAVFLDFKIHGVLYQIPLTEIVYLETINRSIEIHTCHSVQIVPYLTLRNCLEQGQGRLLQCHRSMAVNRDFVERIDHARRRIWLKEDYGWLDLGRRYQKSVRMGLIT